MSSQVCVSVGAPAASVRATSVINEPVQATRTGDQPVSQSVTGEVIVVRRKRPRQESTSPSYTYRRSAPSVSQSRGSCVTPVINESKQYVQAISQSVSQSVAGEFIVVRRKRPHQESTNESKLHRRSVSQSVQSVSIVQSVSHREKLVTSLAESRRATPGTWD